MSRFATDQDVYESLGTALTSAAADEGVAARLQETDAIVQYRLSEPDATLTLDARKTGRVTAEFGETKLEPEIVLSLAADTADDLFRGDLNLTAALASGQIATKGSVTKILKLLPVNLALSADFAEPASPAAIEADADTSVSEGATDSDSESTESDPGGSALESDAETEANPADDTA